jgi:hypothetical protein
MKTDLRWIAGNLDSDSEALEPVQQWIRSELRRKRIRLRKVSLLLPYIICVLVDHFRSFNNATNERVTSGQSFFVGERVALA